MTKTPIVQALTPRWFRGAAHLDDDQQLVYVDRARADVYQPLREHNVGLALMRVRTAADVLDFVRRFGLLRTGDPNAAYRNPLVYEPVHDFIQEADKLRHIVLVTRDVQHAADRDRPVQQRRAALSRIKAHGFSEATLDNLAPASDATAVVLTRGLSHARPFVYDRYSAGESVPPGSIRLGILPDTLIEICYLHVVLALAGDAPLDVCAECGDPFIVEDGRQRFCSSKCGNRARFTRFKQKKQRSRHGTPRKK